jgi:transcriptional regulator with XRE-family HTH domain
LKFKKGILIPFIEFSKGESYTPTSTKLTPKKERTWEVLLMLEHIGQRIRTLRKQKGISLNAFAERLNVSPAYLSNLETGKTDTIQLSLLEKLQEELSLLPVETTHSSDSEFDIRIQHVMRQLKELEQKHPEIADYLLSTLERGVHLFLNENSTR